MLPVVPSDTVVEINYSVLAVW